MMRMRVNWCGFLFLGTILVWSFSGNPASGQLLKFPDPSFNGIYPAGAQQGQTVDVTLMGPEGLDGATDIVIDGPSGIVVRDVRDVSDKSVTATFEIAANAVPGRRRVRILGGKNGLTNWRSFFVGKLPEVMEVEPKNYELPQEVTMPVVVNGRISPTLDVDTYRFRGQQGESIVVAVLAHRMDTLERKSRQRGYLDTSLELRDETGKILASAEDTLGLDPLLHFTLPADGMYSVQVRSLSFQGFDEAIYRLTIGAVPYPTAAFPTGGKRGETVNVELTGPNVPPGTTIPVTIPVDDSFPLQDLTAAGTDFEAINILPFARGDAPEHVLNNPALKVSEATPANLPSTFNARFDQPGTEHWYRISLKKGEGVVVRTMAERHLGYPLDTVLELRDANGVKVTENDDGRPFANECHHDFESADSWLAYYATADGDYFLRVRDQANTAGARAIYRLEVESLLPDFELFQWPDAVPVWGPGTTSSFVVQILFSGRFTSDVELSVEGLPEGWEGSVTPVSVNSFFGYNNTNYGTKGLVTITAPNDAPVGARAPFYVVGRAVQDERMIERRAVALTLLGNGHNDRMHFRFSPESYAVVAPPLSAWLETSTRELSAKPGDRLQIPVTFHRRDENATEMMSVTVDGQTVAVRSAWQPPQAIGPNDKDLMVNLLLRPDQAPGEYGIVVSRSWASDLRAGRPGPCTRLIRLTVLPADK